MAIYIIAHHNPRLVTDRIPKHHPTQIERFFPSLTLIAILFVHVVTPLLVYSLYPGDFNPDHYPNERDPLHRLMQCLAGSSRVFHEASTIN